MSNGATVIYDWYIAPNYDEIEKHLASVETGVAGHFQDAVDKTKNLANEGIAKAKEVIAPNSDVASDVTAEETAKATKIE